MKFIFPANYDFKPKLLGILDYNTAVFNVVWDIFIFCLVNLLVKFSGIKIFLFILLCLPILLFSIIGFNHENFLYVLSYLLKFFLYRGVYLYKLKK